MKQLFTACLFLLTVGSIPTFAQEIPKIPSSVFNDQLEEGELSFPELDPQPQVPTPNVDSLTPPFQQFTIQKFNILGNSALSTSEIQEALNPFLLKQLTNSDIKDINNAISDLYKEKGYSSSSSFISAYDLIDDTSSPQQVIVTIQILEHVISEIEIAGAGRLTPYIRDKFKDVLNQPFNERQFANTLRFLIADERIKTVQTDYLSTELFNESKLQINITPENIVDLTTWINNQQSPFSGEVQGGLQFVHRNLGGIGDELSLIYRRTEGSDNADIAYIVPLNSKDGTLQFGGEYGRYKGVQKSIDQFDLKLEAFSFNVAYRQPILQRSSDNYRQELALGIGVSRSESSGSIFGIPAPLSSGSNIEGKYRSTTLNLLQDFSYLGRKCALKFNTGLTFGIPLGNTNDPFFDDGTFVKFSHQGLFQKQLNQRLSLFSRWSGQIGDRVLAGNQQYSIGNSVRSADLSIARDSGISFSQEIRTLLFQDKHHILELSPFFDLGFASNAAPKVFEQNLLLGSLGIALRYQLNNRLFASIEYAQPVLGSDYFKESSNFRFSVSGKLF